jgi:trimethylamine--corrinoid protein Co-methyltransferase
MRPTLELLSAETVERVLEEAFALLRDPGIKVQAPAALALLEAGGASVDGERARLPEGLVRDALATVPRAFDLHDRDGRPAVRYGQGVVQFDPGSSGVRVLDPTTREPRTSESADLIRLIQVAEGLPQYDAQSTAVVCHDVPAGIGDLYRLFLVLLYSSKPVVTGAFRIPTLGPMIELLAMDAGGPEALAARPRAVFDVCSSPPLTWADLGGQNLLDLARARVPAELISMPIAGAAAPVTLIGSIVQHAAETLSGIVIHQLAGPGAPIVWGGAPAILDMRSGATAMGAIETAMIDAGYAQVGRSLGLPTHAYLCATDAKIVDAQAGLESGISASIGALAGIDLISGAGMLDFLLTQSAEKLVIDADAIGMAKRLAAGIGLPTETLALESFAAVADAGSFLELPETRRLFRGEQFLPSPILDRRSHRAWAEDGAMDAFARAHQRAEALVDAYERPAIDPAAEAAMAERVQRAAADLGIELATMPGLPERLSPV